MVIKTLHLLPIPYTFFGVNFNRIVWIRCCRILHLYKNVDYCASPFNTFHVSIFLFLLPTALLSSKRNLHPLLAVPMPAFLCSPLILTSLTDHLFPFVNRAHLIGGPWWFSIPPETSPDRLLTLPLYSSTGFSNDSGLSPLLVLMVTQILI